MAKKTRALMLAASAVTLLTWAGASFAQVAAQAQADEATTADTGDIIVTAQRRSESLIKLPLAIQAIGGESLATAGVTNLASLNTLTPSFQLAIIGTDPVIGLRGISGEVNLISGEPSVTVSLDGVPFARQQYFLGSFFDVDRVEVLRGPQGTIAGRNSTGGAINLISKRPTDTFEAGLDATYGNYNTITTNGYISGPLAEGLTARIAVRTNDRDGFLHNVNPSGPKDFGDAQERMVRGSLQYKPAGSDFQALLTVDRYISNSNGPANKYIGGQIPFGQIVDGTDFLPFLAGQAGTITQILDPSGPEPGLGYFQVNQFYRTPVLNRMRMVGASLKMSLELGSNTSITSITGYRHFSQGVHFVADGSSTGSVEQFEFLRDRQLTQELTLTSDFGDNFDILLGGLYLHDKASQEVPSLIYNGFALAAANDPRGAFTFQFNDKQLLNSASVYGQARWRFLDGLQLTVGARYTKDRKAFDEAIFLPAGSPTPALTYPLLGFASPQRKSFSSFTPRVALDYRPNDDLTIYASWSKGFKAGGFNSASLLSSGAPNPFNPEKVTNYEAGIKTRFLDNRATANLTVFQADYSALQVPFFFIGGTRVVNAASARIRGVEFETTFRPTDELQLGLNANYLDAKYKTFCARNGGRPDLLAGFPVLTAAQCGVSAGTNLSGFEDLSGDRLPRAPKISVTANATYTIDLADHGTFDLYGDVSYESNKYFTVFHEDNMRQKGYALVNLRTTYTTPNKRISVSGFVKNVFQQHYYSNIISLGINAIQLLQPGNPATAVPGATRDAFLGEPRTYGLTVGFRY